MKSPSLILKEYFGHSSFRAGQENIVNAILSSRDVLCIMPTGAGKSICYQVPALAFSGVTIVVSPLISLMKDQVGALVQSGIAAAFINSSLSSSQYAKVLENTKNGAYKIIYVAPERLEVPEFIEVCNKIDISLVAIDEAHCVSQWGQDFRPSYLKIVNFIAALSTRPIVGAFTATATEEVKKDILKILKLQKPLCVTTGFDRPNLFFSVMKPNSKENALLDLVKERSEKSGIVYCSTRKTVEQVCLFLNENGFSSTRYHAGLKEDERKLNQEDFVYDRKLIMVATNAFEMGIDKSNVSFVIHYNMPKSIESYYQEAGRAGRDGEEADCILLYSPGDVRTNKFLINHSEPNDELSDEENLEFRRRQLERLKYMTFYCTTKGCLRNYILKYFGDSGASYCGKCSNCLTKFKAIDITIDAQKILSCVARVRQKYTKTLISDILHGSNRESVLNLELNMLSTYGIMSEYNRRKIYEIIDALEMQGFLRFEGTINPILKLTAKSFDVLRGNATVYMKDTKEIKQYHKQNDADGNIVLLKALKDLRAKIAKEQRVPAYIIFSDAALVDMCWKHPNNKEDFLEISGVGNAKLEKYGDLFLNVILGNGNLNDFDSSTFAKAVKRDLPKRAGLPWGKDEDAQLQMEYKSGLCIKVISEKHERTKGAIESQLKRDGVVL